MDESLPGISCFCSTYGRPKRLVENAIQCFLEQDYKGPKELVILNDFAEQELVFDHPEVRIINVKERITPLGKKFNENVKLCKYPLIAVWEDDDIFLKHRLSYSQAHMKDGVFHSHNALWEKGPRQIEVTKNLFHGQLMFTRELFDRIGGYKEADVCSIDVELFNALRSECGDFSQLIPKDKLFYVYVWQESGSYHGSGMGAADTNVSDTASRIVQQHIAEGKVSTGVIQLSPALRYNFYDYLPDAPPKPVAIKPKKLTIGMAVYEDFDGVYFTIQALRYYHRDVDRDRIEFLVVDNCPDGVHSAEIKRFVEGYAKGRYIPAGHVQGNTVKGLIFDHAETEYVLCIDSHVLLEPGGVKALLDYYDANPGCNDLIQGPLLYDDIHSEYISTHFKPGWGSGMYGQWDTDERAKDKSAAPFEILMQGCGLFSCRKEAWPGFNPRLKGFAVEEFYIHEKFRQAGNKCLCLPALRWMHRFGRPGGVKYKNVWEDRLRNYLISWAEIGQPLDGVVKHFVSILGEEKVKAVIYALARESEKRHASHCV